MQVPDREWFRPPYQLLTYLTNTSGEILPAEALQEDILNQPNKENENE